ncbi:MAG: DNA polymerase III subunit delta [Spirochaetales bacterium]|nr:DNA polymerase III subunit delta [Spirochaetales bacterium]
MTDNDNIYLLLGPEEGEKFNYIRQKIRDISQKNGEKPEILRLFAFETNIVDIVALMQSQSLFAQHTVIVLNNTEAIRNANDIKVLGEYIKNPSTVSTLFLLSRNIGDISKGIESGIPRKNRIIFWELYENKKREWLNNFFRNRQIRMSDDAIQLLLEMVQNNTYDFKSECNKLALFFGPGAVVHGDDLEKYLFHSKEENVFTLFERIAGRDFVSAIEILEKILASGESDSIALINGLLWQMRKLLSIKILLNDNFHKDEIFQRLAIRNKKSQRIYAEAHSRYGLNEVKQIIILVSDFDKLLRSIRSDLHRLLLQLFLYYCIKKGGMKPQIKDMFFS